MYLNSTTYKKAVTVFCFFLLSSSVSNAQFYSGSQTDFGKNRVKYKSFFWTYYPYERYDVYFYEQGKEIANYVSKAAKKELTEVEKLFDFSIDGKMQFLVFNKQSDFKQSNIGLSSEEQYNTGGTTRIAGSKVMLYFEGDHAKLDAQIRGGIAQVLIDQLMYGGKTREIIKNNTLLNLPEWYTKGLIQYVSDSWNSDVDNRVKDGILSGKYKNINRLEGVDAAIAGHALWKHIADNYGEAVISNILYMSKVSRNIDNSTLFVLGVPIKSLWAECVASYQNKYRTTDETQKNPTEQLVLKKTKLSRIYSQFKVSPDGNFAIYTSNEMGQVKIWLYNFQTNKTKRILKFGNKIDRINDTSFPLLAWHPSGKLFSYIIERKENFVMTTYEPETGTSNERAIFGFEKLLDYSYNADGKKFVLSAVQKGQSDLFIFTTASNGYEQITNDGYDDLNPRFADEGKKIVFVSNRISDTLLFDTKRTIALAPKNKDIFAFDAVSKSNLLIRVTNTPSVNETQPSEYSSSYISYLSDKNGIRNRYLAKFDSVIAFVDTTAHYKTIASSFPATNYSRNIVEQDINTKANKLTEVLFENGCYKLFVQSMPNPQTIAPLLLKNTSYRDYKNKLDARELLLQDEKNKTLSETPTAENVRTIISIEEKKDSNEVDIHNYTFSNEQKKKTKTTTPSSVNIENDTTLATQTNDEFVLARQRNYNTHYSVDYVVSQLDNNFLNASYQKFAGGGSPIYMNPGINAFFKIGMSDLFENYRIVGGMRFSGDLNSNEYFLSYEDRMKNIDKQLILHRQSLLDISDSYSLIKIHTHDARYIFKFPFSEVAGIRASIAYRNDRTIYTSTDYNNLKKNNSYENWGSVKVEYVFDNSIKKGLNLYNGLRGKVFGEYYRQLEKNKSDFFVLGMDWRYYKKLHRDLIWANRISAGTSFGNKKLIYYLGGVDNWFIPKFDNSTNIARDQNYTYQTLVTNMRGFYQNARNGNSFVVINSELRFPIFKYLYKRPIRSDFITNFQLIAFGDLGTAWNGPDPYSDKNALNTTYVDKPPLLIVLKTQHNPFVGGYGIGIRSRLFGYFIRLDRAWGVQDGIVLKPLWHLSLSLDF